MFSVDAYGQYKNYIVFVTLNSTDKQNNLEISSLWILPIVTTLVKYKINASQLTMSFVCRFKCIVCSVIETDNGTITMFKLLKLLVY